MSGSMKLIQPYFVIHTDYYYKAICARYGILHFYMYTLQDREDISAVPDGCIDLVFEYGDGVMNARACGTVFSCQKTLFQFGHTYFGVRFLSGVRPCILDTSPRELVCCEADLREITTCKDFLEKMEGQTTFAGCAHTFLEEYGRIFEKENQKASSCAHVLVDHSIGRIYETGGRIKVCQMEEETGYSSRYINKVFNEELGYGPKFLCKIVQFQNVLTCMNSLESRLEGHKERLTDVAVDFGYYDQPQLIRDFKKFASMTPKTYEKLICKAQYSRHLIEEKIF